MTTTFALAALLVIVGLVGIVVPVLPGLLLVVVGVLVWALGEQSGLGWTTLAIAVILYAVGLAAQYLVPGRQLRSQGVGQRTVLLALVVAIVGFFVIPVIGGPLGFVAAIFVIEFTRTRTWRSAWQRTVAALRAVATSMGIELATGLTIAMVLSAAVVIGR